jgi:hypothetical protein
VETAERANRKPLCSKAPTKKVTTLQVWYVLRDAKGRCTHCGSLAVETLKSNPIMGSPVKWGPIGRRVGSLEHIKGRFLGGDNDFANLAWSCLLCNNWIAESPRKQGISCRGSTDSGGYYPDPNVEPDAIQSEAIVAAHCVKTTGKAWSAEEAFGAAPKPAWLDDDDDSDLEMFPDHECPWDIRMGMPD